MCYDLCKGPIEITAGWRLGKYPNVLTGNPLESTKTSHLALILRQNFGPQLRTKLSNSTMSRRSSRKPNSMVCFRASSTSTKN